MLSYYQLIIMLHVRTLWSAASVAINKSMPRLPSPKSEEASASVASMLVTPLFCVDVNECAENIDDCNSDESCLNTIGSFQCTLCPIGFQPNGQSCIGKYTIIH